MAVNTAFRVYVRSEVNSGQATQRKVCLPFEAFGVSAERRVLAVWRVNPERRRLDGLF